MASGSTARLGLPVYGALDDYDYLELNAANQDIDDSIGVNIYTSTTKPTGPDLYPGRTAYESDTKRVVMWNGTAWIMIGFVPCMNRRSRTTTMAVANGATVYFDNFQTSEQTLNGGDLVHAAGVFTISYPGTYFWSIGAEWQAVALSGTGTGRRRVFARMNGTTVLYDGITDDMPASGQSLNSGIRVASSGMIRCNAGDTFEFGAFNSSGAALVIDTGATATLQRVSG